MNSKKKLGIIGGMGSVASAYFFERLVELTDAKTDQEYIEIFLHNNTEIPDRTDGILYGKTSPLAELLRSVSLLNSFSADYILMACLTSHYYVSQLQPQSKAVIINIVKETVEYITQQHPAVKNIGIIASTGAIKLELFQKELQVKGLQPIIMSDSEQMSYFTEPIYKPWGIKAGFTTGRPKECIFQAIEILQNKGSDLIIAGCSELPLVIKENPEDIIIIDSIDIGLKKAIQVCLN